MGALPNRHCSYKFLAIDSKESGSPISESRSWCGRGISTVFANRTVELVVVAAIGDKVPMGVARAGAYAAVDTRCRLRLRRSRACMLRHKTDRQTCMYTGSVGLEAEHVHCSVKSDSSSRSTMIDDPYAEGIVTFTDSPRLLTAGS